MTTETETHTPTDTPSSPTATISTWKAAKRHTVTLPSGTVVDIVLPNLPKMLHAGEVPNPLVKSAMDSIQGGTITEEKIREQFTYYQFLVANTVVDPTVAPEDVADLPFEDIEMLVELATRNRDVDAVGHQLAGLEKVTAWRRFRGYDGSDALGAGL